VLLFEGTSGTGGKAQVCKNISFGEHSTDTGSLDFVDRVNVVLLEQSENGREQWSRVLEVFV